MPRAAILWVRACRAANPEIMTIATEAPATTVSIGVASLKGDELNATDLIKYADKALYMAKNNGRNQVFCFS